MGVHGLWDAISPCGHRMNLEMLSGRVIAIDASIWLYQFIRAMRDRDGNSVRGAHLIGFFKRICKLLFFRIRPIFVFDGRPPELKRRTLLQRRRAREQTSFDISKTAEKLLKNAIKMRLMDSLRNSKKSKKGSPKKSILSNEESPIQFNSSNSFLSPERLGKTSALSLPTSSPSHADHNKRFIRDATVDFSSSATSRASDDGEDLDKEIVDAHREWRRVMIDTVPTQFRGFVAKRRALGSVEVIGEDEELQALLSGNGSHRRRRRGRNTNTTAAADERDDIDNDHSNAVDTLVDVGVEGDQDDLDEQVAHGLYLEPDGNFDGEENTEGNGDKASDVTPSLKKRPRLLLSDPNVDLTNVCNSADLPGIGDVKGREFKSIRFVDSHGQERVVAVPLDADIDQEAFNALPAKLQYQELQRLKDRMALEARRAAVQTADDMGIFSYMQIEAHVRDIRVSKELNKVKQKMANEAHTVAKQVSSIDSSTTEKQDRSNSHLSATAAALLQRSERPLHKLDEDLPDELLQEAREALLGKYGALVASLRASDETTEDGISFFNEDAMRILAKQDELGKLREVLETEDSGSSGGLVGAVQAIGRKVALGGDTGGDVFHPQLRTATGSHQGLTKRAGTQGKTDLRLADFGKLARMGVATFDLDTLSRQQVKLAGREEKNFDAYERTQQASEKKDILLDGAEDLVKEQAELKAEDIFGDDRVVEPLTTNVNASISRMDKGNADISNLVGPDVEIPLFRTIKSYQKDNTNSSEFPESSSSQNEEKEEELNVDDFAGLFEEEDEKVADIVRMSSSSVLSSIDSSSSVCVIESDSEHEALPTIESYDNNLEDKTHVDIEIHDTYGNDNHSKCHSNSKIDLSVEQEEEEEEEEEEQKQQQQQQNHSDQLDNMNKNKHFEGDDENRITFILDTALLSLGSSAVDHTSGENNNQTQISDVESISSEDEMVDSELKSLPTNVHLQEFDGPFTNSNEEVSVNIDTATQGCSLSEATPVAILEENETTTKIISFSESPKQHQIIDQNAHLSIEAPFQNKCNSTSSHSESPQIESIGRPYTSPSRFAPSHGPLIITVSPPLDLSQTETTKSQKTAQVDPLTWMEDEDIERMLREEEMMFDLMQEEQSVSNPFEEEENEEDIQDNHKNNFHVINNHEESEEFDFELAVEDEEGSSAQHEDIHFQETGNESPNFSEVFSDTTEKPHVDLMAEWAEWDELFRVATGVSERTFAEVRDQLQEERRELELRQRKLEMSSNEAIVTAEMRGEIKDLLKAFGIPWVDAPSEAEAQCSTLCQMGFAHGVISDDSDCIIFGADNVFRRFFDNTKRIEAYSLKNIETGLGLVQSQLPLLALLLGCDYTEGVGGVGIVNAVEVLRAFPDIDGLRKWRRWSTDLAARARSKDKDDAGIEPGDSNEIIDYKQTHKQYRWNFDFPSDFPSEEVVAAFLKPVVDKSDEPFQWGFVSTSAVCALLVELTHLSVDDIQQTLLPVLRRQELRQQSGNGQRQTYQATLGQFFEPLHKKFLDEKVALVKSKRMKKALHGLKKKGEK